MVRRGQARRGEARFFLILSAISLLNFGPYRGQQRLELAASYYGVEARRVDDDARSNGSGKTMFLESVPFAIWGWLNPDRGLGVGGWISDGETSGAVRVTFDDDFWVERERDEKLSKEKEQVRTSSGAMGDEAVREAEARLGLSRDDLFAARFVRQRQAARFVLAKPEERMSVVGDWLQLAPLEAAEKLAGKELAEREKALAAAQASLDVARRVAEQAGKREELEKAWRAAGSRLEDAKERAQLASSEAREAREEMQRASAARESAGRYAAVVEKGRALAERLKAMDVDALGVEHKAVREEQQRLRSVVDGLQMDLKMKAVVARGEFDGACPVAAIECPARTLINADRVRSRAAEKEASAAYARAAEDLRVLDGRVESLGRELREWAYLGGKLSGLREEAKRLKPQAAEGAPTPEQEADWEGKLLFASQRLEEVRGLERETDRLEALLRAAQAADEALAGARAKLEAAEGSARVAREGVAIFRAARRKIAEAALGQIERDANAGLARVSEDLSFELSWSRPGSGIAKTCDACGEPFDRSAKVKSCFRCGAARGPNLVEKLELVLSQQSGALEDLVGVFLSIASAKWLSEDRGSPFETMMFDEVQSHLDRSHRQAFIRRLPSVLEKLGCRQAFVISHDRASIETLPGRILIESDGRFSTMRVV